MNSYIKPREWGAKGEIVLEEAADKAVKTNTHLLVVAGPGAGKTELLAQKTDFLFQTNLSKNPQKILAISFKKDAADNLRERITKRYGNDYANRFTSLTYDAFAKRILDQFRNALPADKVPDKNYLVEDKENIDKFFDKHDSDFRNTSYRKNKDQIIDDYLYVKRDEKIWESLLKGVKDYDIKPCLTFKMISILAKKIILMNPKIKEALQATYSHVFLDEFQDTTDLQYELVKVCFLDGQSIITAVGDSKQRIMGWAGARETIFTDFQTDFGAEKISLIMNYRSVPRLVKLQKMMYDVLQEEELDAQPSSKWKLNDGEVKLFKFSNEQKEAEGLTDDIYNKMKEGTKPEDICILVKQTAEKYSPLIISNLDERFGIKARIENEYQNLLKEPVVNLIIDVLKCSLKIQEIEEWEYLEDFWLNTLGIDNSLDDKSFDQAQKDIQKLLVYCQDSINNIRDKEGFLKITDDIVARLGMENISRAYPEYGQGNNLKNTLNSFVNLFCKELSSWDNFPTLIKSFQGENTIPIMTIHKSKGLEYDAVYFVGLEDSAFWNFKNQPKEDRSAFFVGISRAKKYLSFSYCANRESLANKFNPSGNQERKNINEFFDLLQQPEIATIMGDDI